MNQTEESQCRVLQKKFKEYDQLTIQGRIHPPLASPEIESEQPIYNYFVVNE